MEKLTITKQEAVRIIGTRAYRLVDTSYHKAMEIFSEYLDMIRDTVRAEWCMPSLKEWLSYCASNKHITIFRGTVLSGSREEYGPNSAMASLQCIGKFFCNDDPDNPYFNLFVSTSYGFPTDTYEISVRVNTKYDDIRRVRRDVELDHKEYLRYTEEDAEQIRFDKYLNTTITEILQDVNLDMSDLPQDLMDIIGNHFVHNVIRNFETTLSAAEMTTRIAIELPLVTIEYDTWDSFFFFFISAMPHQYFKATEKLNNVIRKFVSKPFVSEKADRILHNYGILRTNMVTKMNYAEVQVVLNLNVVRMENDFRDGIVF